MIGLRGYAIAVAAGLCIGWAGNGLRMGAQLSDLRAEHAERLEGIAAQQASAIAEQMKIRQQLQQQLAAIDQQRQQELTHAQHATDRLAAELRSAERRLSVRTTTSCGGGLPGTTSPAGLGDGADRADIHPEAAEGLVRVAGDADRCAVKLSALQDWARALADP